MACVILHSDSKPRDEQTVPDLRRFIVPNYIRLRLLYANHYYQTINLSQACSTVLSSTHNKATAHLSTSKAPIAPFQALFSRANVRQQLLRTLAVLRIRNRVLQLQLGLDNPL